MSIFKKCLAVSLSACLVFGLTACQKQTGADESVATNANENGTQLDQQFIDSLLGEYQVVENEVDGDEYVGTWWHLSIRNAEDGSLELSIYDNEAGNPGIEGKVIILDDKNISIKYDPDYYDELPSALWNVDGEDLNLTYHLTDTGVELTNSKKTLTFRRQYETVTYSSNWKSPDKDALQNIEITDTEVKISGFVYTANDGWTEGEYAFTLADDCIFDDCVKNELFVEKEEFLQVLNSEDADHTVFEIDVQGDVANVLRLTHFDASELVFQE